MKGKLEAKKTFHRGLKPNYFLSRFVRCVYLSDEPIYSSSKFSAKLYPTLTISEIVFYLTEGILLKMPPAISSAKLATLSTVTRMDIDFTPSDHVLPGIGEVFSNLKILRISGLSIRFVERRDFNHMKQLTILGMDGLSLDFLSDDLIIDLPNLLKLEMTSCRIDKLPEKIFAIQTKLRWLYLDRNSLTVLDKDLFKFNLNLEAVYLEGNNLMQIFVDFTKLTEMVRVDLTNNDCMSRSYERVEQDRIETLQNATISCCRERYPDKSNCLCFPYSKACRSAQT